MMTLSSGEVAIALVLPLLAAAAQTTLSLRRTLRSRLRARCVAQIARVVVVSEGRYDEELGRLQRLYMRGTIAESVSFASEYIYGGTHDRLIAIADRCGVRWHPCCGRRLQGVAKDIVAQPERAIGYIAELEEPLSWGDVASLMQLLRRTGAPIAYTPLLMSQSRNLQLLGLYICSHFAIADAEPLLQRLVASADREVARAALFTLCALRSDIATPRVALAISRFPLHHRSLLVRHIVQACYSVQSCARILSLEERQLLAERINSYKSKIACN